MLANKKAFKDGTAANEESGSSMRPPSPNSAQLPVSASFNAEIFMSKVDDKKNHENEGGLNQSTLKS